MPTDPTLTELKFWTVAEVAALVRVSRMTIYRLVHNGELQHQRIGRSIRIHDQSVTAYFNLTPPDGPP